MTELLAVIGFIIVLALAPMVMFKGLETIAINYLRRKYNGK